MKKVKLILITLSSAIGGIVLFVAGLYGYFYFKYKDIEDYKRISMTPTFQKEVVTGKYLGILGLTSGKFDWTNQKQLSSGKGVIKGHILKDGGPCSGLKIYLLFNGNVISEPATSDKNGEYFIKVPFGKYRMVGWRIDYKSAGKVLDGKILEPDLYFGTKNIEVSDNKITEGPSLNFINPIKILKPQSIIAYSDNIEFGWTAVKNTKTYRIRLIDRGEGLRGTQYRPIFETYKDMPTTANTYISTKDMGIKLNQGHHYTVQVEALNDINQPITESSSTQDGSFFIQKQ